MDLSVEHKLSVPSAQPLFLATDIGGTHARISLICPNDEAGFPVTMLAYRDYVCAQWPNLTAIFRDFLEQTGVQHVNHCVVASTGYVFNGIIVNENLPWTVDISDLRATLQVDHFEVINDFEAVAYSAQFLRQTDTMPVIDTHVPSAPAPVLVVGPGTGFGCAVLLPGQPHASVLPTEGGHAALAPGNEREIEVLRLLMQRFDYVSSEHVLSGPGLLNLYQAICRLHHVSPTLTQAAQISVAALTGEDDVALETLHIFCAMLGSFVGDLAVSCGTRGGVFLAGGILPKIADFLRRSQFAERFLSKGVTRQYLEQIPVRLMEHGKLGVLGAASLYLNRHLNI